MSGSGESGGPHRPHTGPRGDGCQSGPDSWPCRSCVEETSQRLLSLQSGGTVCATCHGYYGSANGQPVCATCHAFLYANDVDVEANAQLLSEERRQGVLGDADDENDSGNDEPEVEGGAAAAAQQPQGASAAAAAPARAELPGAAARAVGGAAALPPPPDMDAGDHPEPLSADARRELVTAAVMGERAVSDAVHAAINHEPIPFDQLEEASAAMQAADANWPQQAGDQPHVSPEIQQDPMAILNVVDDLVNRGAARAANFMPHQPAPLPPQERQQQQLQPEVHPDHVVNQNPAPPLQGAAEERQQHEDLQPIIRARFGDDMMVIASSDGEEDGVAGGGGGRQGAAAGVLDRHHVRMESLSDRLAMLSVPRPIDEPEVGDSSLVGTIPPEVLEIIFSYLDDISLYSVGQTCRRWRSIIRRKEFCWKSYTRMRWPLFKPMSLVNDWFEAYSKIVKSCFCLTCIYQMAEIIPEDAGRFPSRERRVGSELRSLMTDPPEGLRATPLDSSYYHWQATISGPVSSPYEGGLFYIYMKVPLYYPFYPPEVRFLTRIFHPNISRHGDVGIDLILQHNWSCGMTLSKVLISIQSLLTDPFTKVCMEPDVGHLYDTNKKMFESVARKWTYQYAMCDIHIKG